MNDKRTLKGTKYSISEIVTNAIAAVESQTLDTEKARQSLTYLGHRNPDDALVIRYARESAILNILARETGANGFQGQIGKIDFSSTENAIASVQKYLDRRISANHARWTANRR